MNVDDHSDPSFARSSAVSRGEQTSLLAAPRPGSEVLDRRTREDSTLRGREGYDERNRSVGLQDPDELDEEDR